MRGRPLGAGKKLEERRHRAVQEALEAKVTRAAIAKKYGVSLRALYGWLASYARNKKHGLKSRPTPGAPRKLSEKQLKLLEHLLLEGAKAAGFSNDLWSCPRIAGLIEKKFGIVYHVDHVGRILARLGWSPQRPEKRAIERDDRRIRNWVKKEFPRIKKKLAT